MKSLKGRPRNFSFSCDFMVNFLRWLSMLYFMESTLAWDSIRQQDILFHSRLSALWVRRGHRHAHRKSLGLFLQSIWGCCLDVVSLWKRSMDRWGSNSIRIQDRENGTCEHLPRFIMADQTEAGGILPLKSLADRSRIFILTKFWKSTEIIPSNWAERRENSVSVTSWNNSIGKFPDMVVLPKLIVLILFREINDGISPERFKLNDKSKTSRLGRENMPVGTARDSELSESWRVSVGSTHQAIRFFSTWIEYFP